MTYSKTPDILKKIVETKKEEIQKILPALKSMRQDAESMPKGLDFKAALRKKHLTVIAEIKKASPSVGVISNDFDHRRVAEAYLKASADAVSVLTDVKYFQGSLDYMKDAKKILSSTPVLRKDFVIHEVQIYEARCAGADTFLLIAEILEKSCLEDFILLGRSLGMEPLVESHDGHELEKALEAGAAIAGINNRNLRNFEVSLETSLNLKKYIPSSVVAVSESGIKLPSDAHMLRSASYDAILAGEALMRAGLDGCVDLMAEFKGV